MKIHYFLVFAVLFAPVAAVSQEATVTKPEEAKLSTFPGLPDCATGTVTHGDPASGASVLLVKSAAGCTIPWHWHTANEELTMVNGSGQFQMQGSSAQTVASGAYVWLPAQHPHQFSCPSGCTLYVRSDAPFDIHYVNSAGAEITPENALKQVGERAAMPQK